MHTLSRLPGTAAAVLSCDGGMVAAPGLGYMEIVKSSSLKSARSKLMKDGFASASTISSTCSPNLLGLWSCMKFKLTRCFRSSVNALRYCCVSSSVRAATRIKARGQTTSKLPRGICKITFALRGTTATIFAPRSTARNAASCRCVSFAEKPAMAAEGVCSRLMKCEVCAVVVKARWVS